MMLYEPADERPQSELDDTQTEQLVQRIAKLKSELEGAYAVNRTLTDNLEYAQGEIRRLKIKLCDFVEEIDEGKGRTGC